MVDPRQMGRSTRNWLGMWSLAVSASAIIACGPIEYINQVTRKADGEVEAAEALGASDDPTYQYWYTLAREYLYKAREEAALADYQAANRFGRKAELAARKAREAALQSAADPASAPRAPAPVAPAGRDDDGFSDIGVDEGELDAPDGTDDELPPGMDEVP